MKNVFVFIILAVCSLLPSCLTTLQPLVTAVNIIQDNRLKGNWQYASGDILIEALSDTKSATVLGDKAYRHTTIKKNDNESDAAFLSKNYSVIFKHNHYQHMMAGALTRVGKNLFFQLIPLGIDDRLTDGTDFEYSFDYSASFSIGKVNFENNQMSIQFLNGDHIKDLIRNGQIRIRHEKDNLFGSFVITASSNELSQFLEKYGDDERFYSKSNTITLTRKQ